MKEKPKRDLDIKKEEIIEKIMVVKEFYPDMVIRYPSVNMSIEELTYDYKILSFKIKYMNQELYINNILNFFDIFYTNTILHNSPDEFDIIRWKEIVDFIYINTTTDTGEIIEKISEIFSHEKAEKISNLISLIEHASTRDPNEILECFSDEFIRTGFYFLYSDARFKSYLKSSVLFKYY